MNTLKQKQPLKNFRSHQNKTRVKRSSILDEDENLDYNDGTDEDVLALLATKNYTNNPSFLIED
jgi:hypothetical protein